MRLEIKKALNHLDNANYPDYFEELNKIVPSNLQTQLSELRNDFISGNNDWKLVQKLKLFAQETEYALNNPNIAQNEEQATNMKIFEIEAKKLKLSVSPRICLSGVESNGSELNINISNKGELAILDNIRLISGDIILHNLHIPYELEKGDSRYIFGRANSSKHLRHSEYEIEILYHDKLRNKFKLIIKGKGANPKIISDEEISSAI